MSWKLTGRTAWAEKPNRSPTQIVGWYSKISTRVPALAGSMWMMKLHRNLAGAPSYQYSES